MLVFYIVFTHIILQELIIENTQGIFILQAAAAYTYFVNKDIFECFFNLYINLACLSVCLSVCLYPINVKTAEPIGPKFFVGHLGTPGKVYEKSKFQIFVFIKIRSSLNF